jgi:hypothetical protein
MRAGMTADGATLPFTLTSGIDRRCPIADIAEVRTYTSVQGGSQTLPPAIWW